MDSRGSGPKRISNSIADTPEQFQPRCALVEVAAEYRVPFSSESLETLRKGMRDVPHLVGDDDRAFANRAQVKALGVTVDAGGSMLATCLAREKAAMRVWFKRLGQL